MKKISFITILFIIIFNFNTIGLPYGVMWSNIFSIGILSWLLLKKQYVFVFLSLFLLLFYMLLQYTTVAISNLTSYILSATYFYTSVLVGIFFFTYLNTKKLSSQKLDEIFMKIIKINIMLTLIAILLYFTPLKEQLWITSNNINSLGETRLRLFFYEPAHYAYIFIVFLLYLFLNFFLYSEKKYFLPLLITLLSIFLTKSLGVLSSMAIAFFFAALVFFLPLIQKFYKKVFLFFLTLLIILPLIGDSFMYRIKQTIEGKDNSGNVRLIYATQSAYNMIKKYNFYFGVGFGQTKEYVLEFTAKIPGYGSDRLPNTFASTLATVGFIGIILKISFLVFFFLKTHVYQNIFRLTLFFYTFIYGLSGGWMLNVYEFILWAFTFSTIFSKFDKKNILKSRRRITNA